MLKDIVRSAGRRAGLDIFRASTEPFRWSHTVHDYHPVVPSSRWTPGRAPHGQLRSVLARESVAYDAFLTALEAQADLLDALDSDPGSRPLRWRLGVDAAFAEAEGRRIELGNFIRALVLPRHAARSAPATP